MSLYTAFILILSVAYVLYITIQLRSDYRKSRPQEGQAEEHFTFNPDKPANVNSVKVTMNEDVISMVPEYPEVLKSVDTIDKMEDEPVIQQEPTADQGVAPDQVQSENDSLITEPFENSNSEPAKTSETHNQSQNYLEKAKQKSRLEMIYAHTQEYMSKELTADELYDAMVNGKGVFTEVSDDPDYNLEDEKSLDKETSVSDEIDYSSKSGDQTADLDEITSYPDYDHPYNDGSVSDASGSDETTYSSENVNDPTKQDDTSYSHNDEEDEIFDSYGYDPDDDVPDFDDDQVMFDDNDDVMFDDNQAMFDDASMFEDQSQNYSQTPTISIYSEDYLTEPAPMPDWSEDHIEPTSIIHPSDTKTGVTTIPSKFNYMTPIEDSVMEQYDFSGFDKDSSKSKRFN